MQGKLFDLTGKVALVTGSSQGLGLAIARGLAEAGARVVLNGRGEQRLKGATNRFWEDGLQASGAAFDITDETQVNEAVQSIENLLGSVDILVNNAGINLRGGFGDYPLEDWQQMLATNLTGAFLVTRAVVKGMRTRRRGKIINIGSLMSEVGRAGIAPYAVTKGGIRMLTRALAVEYASDNIQVNAIGPGYFLTELTRPLHDDPEFDDWVRRRTPAGRWGKPEELVGAAVFLASPASDFVNGQVLYVDGGFLAAA